MKTAVILSLMILAPLSPAANAAPFDTSQYADFEVISVQPRTIAVKPFVMAIFTQEQRQRMAIAAFKKNALATRDARSVQAAE